MKTGYLLAPVLLLLLIGTTTLAVPSVAAPQATALSGTQIVMATGAVAGITAATAKQDATAPTAGYNSMGVGAAQDKGNKVEFAVDVGRTAVDQSRLTADDVGGLLATTITAQTGFGRTWTTPSATITPATPSPAVSVATVPDRDIGHSYLTSGSVGISSGAVYLTGGAFLTDKTTTTDIVVGICSGVAASPPTSTGAVAADMKSDEATPRVEAIRRDAGGLQQSVGAITMALV